MTALAVFPCFIYNRGIRWIGGDAMPGISIYEARGFLEGLCRGMKARYPAVESAYLVPDVSGGNLLTFRSGGYGVYIGTKELEDGVRDGTVQDRDLAMAAKTACHERRHLYQKEDLYKRPLSRRDLDMAVMEACSMAYKGYYESTYQYRLSETDADREGTREAIAELSAAFPGTDWEAAMLEAHNAVDQAFDDARGGIGFRPDSQPRSRAYQRDRRYGSMDEIYARFDELDGKYLTAAHDEPCREFCEQDDAVCEANGWDGKFFDLLLGDGEKVGPERDREILASVLQARVFDVDAYFPGMAAETARIRKEHHVDSDAVHKLREAAAEMDSAYEEDLTREVPL